MGEEHTKAIGNYTILEIVREAPEGTLYKAVETSTKNNVLLKTYYPSLEWSDEILDEFFNLASYLRFIEHEYLLSVVDIGKHEGKPYVVFADPSATLLCDRETKQADQNEIVNFLYRLAEVLDFLHKQEILHGSLSPENIAIDNNGYPLLFDFGLSGVFKKLLLENMDDGFDNLSIASLQHTSPEQILGRSPTRASDIYAFGIIAYQYIFGESPFNARFVLATAELHIDYGVIRTIKLPEGITGNLFDLIQKCIQSKPEARFTGFAQILASLEQIKAGKKVRLKFNRRFVVTKPPVRIQFRISPLLASAAALIASLFVFYYFYTRTVAVAPPPTLVAMTATAPAPTRPPTQTKAPVLETATPVQVDAPPAAVETAYKPAFENEKSLIPSQTISIENVANLKEISRLGYGKPEEADVAPDDDHIAVATSAGVFIFEGNQLLKWIDPQGWATSVQFSPDNNTLAIGLMTGEIQLWDWRNGTKSPPLEISVENEVEIRHTKKINRILFSESGLLYSGSADQKIIIWDLRSNRSIKSILAHSKPVNDIALASAGRIIISCSDDRLIRVWNANSGAKLYELDSQTGYFSGAIKSIATSPDDEYLAAGSEAGYLYQWKLVTTELSANAKILPRNDTIPVRARIWSVEYSADGNQLLVGADDGVSLIYDATLQTIKGVSYSFEIPKHDKNLLDALGADFDFSSFSVFRGGIPFSLNWDGKVTAQQSQILSPSFDHLDRLDFSPDGDTLAAGGQRGSAHVWNLTTNQTLYQNFYSLPFGDPLALDGSSVALIVPNTNNDEGGYIYQLKNLLGSQTTIDLTEALPNANVGYAQDGNVFIAANLLTAKAWNTTGGEIKVRAVDYFGCRVITSDTNIKDRLLVNSAVDIFPPGDENLIDNLCPKTSRFKDVVSAFSDDLKLVAYINSNGLLEAYDVLTKTSPWQPRRLQDSQIPTAMAISPDGSLIALGDASGNIQFFNGKTGELITEVIGNFGKVQAIEFSEDSKKIATAGTDGVVRVFGIVEIK